EKGNIVEKNLKKAKYSGADLLEQLRMKNIFNASHVEFAILETDGQLSVLPKKPYQPLTPSEIGQQPASAPPPIAVIVDGKLEESALRSAGRDLSWLHKELAKKNLTLNK